MAFDQLVIVVPGQLRHSGQEPDPTTVEVLHRYRDTLTYRQIGNGTHWTIPTNGRTQFRTDFRPRQSTVSKAHLWARWNDDTHRLALTITVNPTRTLLHLLSMGPDAETRMNGMAPGEFFGLAPTPDHARSLDGNDNAHREMDVLIARMGHDHAGAFIGTFEEKLKAWALEAVAPACRGFSHDQCDGKLAADNGQHRVALDWARLSIRHAEIFCERRHGDAPALMNRLASTISAAHVEAHWQAYPLSEIGGRSGSSMSIGIKPTSRIRQIYYAKAQDRIRIETQYQQRLRDNLRDTRISFDMPIASTLLALRKDATDRLQWDAFCTMCEEPPMPMITDFSRLAGVIATCASQAGVDPVPVFSELFGAGGIDETPSDGACPRRLIRRLVAHGLLDGANLARRARPGQARRYHLTPAYLAVATKLQQAFGSGAVQPSAIPAPD